MNLALAVRARRTGRWLGSPESRRSSTPRAVRVGRRDEHDRAYGGEAQRRSAIADVPVHVIRARGPEAIARDAVARAAGVRL